ncbi:hypothetical protein ACMDCR_20795 [Labrys okinawensis]|uniref:hypothetical protein n=1 Tax=Labrys okinawensis TaxID=346911 RepID=UPI0039BD7FBD
MFDDISYTRIAQPARAVSLVEHPLHPTAHFHRRFMPMYGMRRKAVREPEGYELHDLRRIEARKTMGLVPTAMRSTLIGVTICVGDVVCGLSHLLSDLRSGRV